MNHRAPRSAGVQTRRITMIRAMENDRSCDWWIDESWCELSRLSVFIYPGRWWRTPWPSTTNESNFLICPASLPVPLSFLSPSPLLFFSRLWFLSVSTVADRETEGTAMSATRESPVRMTHCQWPNRSEPVSRLRKRWLLQNNDQGQKTWVSR
jgi:hypothetical protein